MCVCVHFRFVFSVCFFLFTVIIKSNHCVRCFKRDAYFQGIYKSIYVEREKGKICRCSQYSDYSVQLCKSVRRKQK